MNIALLYSKKDIAGVNIAEKLREHYLPQIPIIELNKDSIFSENIDKDERLKNFDFIIFASRHKSEKGGKTLSIHAPGNWRSADFGGKSGKICPTSALIMKYLFQKLKENAEKENSDYQVTLECTHHGPLIEKPCCFIELGSNEEQWQDKKTAEIIAKTLVDLQDFEKWKDEVKKQTKIAVGIGGPHYCPNFNKIQLSKKSNIAISHIIPEYCLPLSESMLKEIIEKTKEHVNLFLLDWKGCGKSEERQKIIELLDKFGLEYIRVEKVEK